MSFINLLQKEEKKKKKKKKKEGKLVKRKRLVIVMSLVNRTIFAYVKTDRGRMRREFRGE